VAGGGKGDGCPYYGGALYRSRRRGQSGYQEWIVKRVTLVAAPMPLSSVSHCYRDEKTNMRSRFDLTTGIMPTESRQKF
jgi:hypothetical protein